jgi:hypothetical protein
MKNYKIFSGGKQNSTDSIVSFKDELIFHGCKEYFVVLKKVKKKFHIGPFHPVFLTL